MSQLSAGASKLPRVGCLLSGVWANDATGKELVTLERLPSLFEIVLTYYATRQVLARVTAGWLMGPGSVAGATPSDLDCGDGGHPPWLVLRVREGQRIE